MKELEKLREIWVNDIDISDEDRDENLKVISEWEKGLTSSLKLSDWAEHEITKKIMEEARKQFVSNSLLLANNRNLTTEQRTMIYAKQDAMMWFISLVKDYKAELSSIEREIKQAINSSLQGN